MSLQLGDEWPELQQALSEEQPVSIRLNDKTPLPEFDDAERVPWCDAGRYLNARPRFTLDPLLHAGCYYVQEAGSMFLQQVCEQLIPTDSIVLDLCAAPGGKSTLLAQHLSNGLLVANEVMRQRAQILAENVAKWGSGNVLVTSNRPAEVGQLRHLFDALLVDAPCSGEGMFRKDAGAVSEWSVANAQMCAERQRAIMNDVWDALRPGGLLIYSTCTFNPEENEQNVHWICEHLGADLLTLQVSDAWNLYTTGTGYHFYPHRQRSEGFYIACMRKHEGERQTMRLKSSRGTSQRDSLHEMRQWLNQPDEWLLTSDAQYVHAVRRVHTDMAEAIGQRLYCLLRGIRVAEMRGRNWIPAHQLALSKHIRQSAFRQVNADLPTALSYLHGEAVHFTDAPTGQLLVCYQNVPVGWIKNIGNRSNNLYPDQWRIRMNV